MSHRPIASKPSAPKSSDVHRLQINPHRSDVLGRSTDHSILDLGTGLLCKILDDEEAALSPESQKFLRQRIHDPSVATTQVQPSFPSIGSVWMTPRHLAEQLCHRAFEICYRLSEIIPEDELDATIHRLYAVDPAHWGLEEYDSMALLSVVLALAHAVDWKVHQALGCEKAVAESEAYYRTVNGILELNKRQITSLTQLRTVMAMMLYQLITKSAAAALDLLNIACLATVNLGLYHEFSFSEEIVNNENDPRQNLLWTLLYFDMYLCGLLAIPTFIDTYSSEAATLATIRHAARNVGTHVRSSQSFILTVGLALQIELFKLMRKGSQANRNQDWTEVRRIKCELEDWETLFTNIFPQDEIINVVARTRYELRMSHYLAVISLCSPHIRFVGDKSVRTGFVSALQSELAQRCVQTSLDAVNASVTYCRLPGHSPFVEPSAYALFVAMTCLTAAVPRTEGSVQLKALTRIEQGLQLVAHVSCSLLGETKSYLTLIRDVVTAQGLLDVDAAISNSTNTVPDLVSHNRMIAGNTENFMLTQDDNQ